MLLGVIPVALLLGSGALVGITLGLFGGGGSILAALVVVGGVAGAFLGTRANVHLAGHERALTGTFASVVIAIGLYIVVSGILKFAAIG